MTGVKTFRFLDFKLYKDAKKFYNEIIELTKAFSREYWDLGNQLRRCALSPCLNIAEGSGKYSDREFNRYTEIGLGSINEAAACLDIAHDNNLITKQEYENKLSQAKNIANQLGGLSKKLRASR